MGKYLEHMKIGDAKRLADQIHVPLIALLDASLSLSQDVDDIDLKRSGDLTKLRNRDVAIAV